jgi:hypothetical protein
MGMSLNILEGKKSLRAFLDFYANRSNGSNGGQRIVHLVLSVTWNKKGNEMLSCTSVKYMPPSPI